MDSPAISQIHTLCLQMERHLSTPFPFSLWAKHCHYSPYHLRHLFTACRPINTCAVGA